MIKKFLLATVIIFSATTGFAQKKKKDKKGTATEQSNPIIDSLNKYILAGLNKMRVEAKLDSLESNKKLVDVSEIQSGYMADKGEVTLDGPSGKLGTTGKRLKSKTGSTNAEELVYGIAMSKGKTTYSPKEVADQVITKWKGGKKEKVIILNPNYVYASPSARMDKDNKKAYISVVFGGYNSFNEGAKKKKELKPPFTKKQYKLKKPEDIKECKNCDKFKEWQALYEGLSVRDKKIYFKYDDLKALKKLLKADNDGFAIDIVQRAQYEKENYNIMDNNLLSKGIYMKKFFAPKLFNPKKNLVKDPKSNSIEIVLGKFPPKITGDYELNLHIIQGGKICKVILRSYMEEGVQESSTPLEMILAAETESACNPPFQAKAEATTLTFTIPFEKNKSTYNPDDIKPFLDALQEPDFIVDNIDIIAYSSIEGNVSANNDLQRKRAESIVSSFQKKQTKQIKPNIKTSDSWDLFQVDMEGTPYANLTKMSKEAAINEINTKPGLSNELEQYLAKQRFAKITMNVVYDIAGNEKEQKFAVSQFNKAVKNGDQKQAMKIMCFIQDNVMKKKYTEDAFAKLQIPAEGKFSNLWMNKVVYSYIRNKKVATPEHYTEMKKIATADPSNSYVTFNNLFCMVKLDDVTDKKFLDDNQKKIDALYTNKVPKNNVDALNIEFQFKSMGYYDTIPNSEANTQTLIDKIKGFYNFKEASWQNSLKLAYVFMKFKDFKFATQILEPYLNQPKVDEKLVFGYISACSMIPEKYNSKSFVTAMRKAAALNKQKYCKLFGAPFISFQALDNPSVKEDYLKADCK